MNLRHYAVSNGALMAQPGLRRCYRRALSKINGALMRAIVAFPTARQWRNSAISEASTLLQAPDAGRLDFGGSLATRKYIRVWQAQWPASRRTLVFGTLCYRSASAPCNCRPRQRGTARGS
jgi:hypothetical protein